MKKALFSAMLLAICQISLAQNIATTTPQHVTAVLEEYTGIHCGFCPDGHKLATELKNDYPNQVILVNVHTGGYAVPSGNEPDYRTAFGTNLANQTNLAGYPSGTVSRHVFSNLASTMALNRGSWRAAAESILANPSPVTVGATSTFNAGTRVLTVDVEAYYNADAANATNKINVVLIQDSLLGPQSGGTNFNPTNYVNGQYVHNHMLRHLISGQWGSDINSTTAGSLFSQTYTYTLPADVNGVTLDPSQCHLAVYVTETQRDVTHGITLGLNETNDGNTAPIYVSYTNLNDQVLGGSPSNGSTFNLDFNPLASGANDYILELTADAPTNWNGDFSIGSTVYPMGSPQTINMASGSVQSISINVTPGASADVAKYTLTAKLASDPAAVFSQEVHVISGVTDLVVNGSGAFGNGNSYSWEQMYSDGLNSAGNTTNSITSSFVMKEAITSGAINGVRNIYMNIGWTFPSFTDEEVLALESFMDNGGDVLVAGQDIGWDINDAAGNGTAASKSFYTNYLHADYKGDGNAINNTLDAVSSDNIFGNVAPSAIVDKYSGNIYPDEMDPINGGVPIFNYNGDATKIGGIRYSGAYKMVFLGIGIEMIDDDAVRDEVVKLSYLWFNDFISVDEFDASMKSLNAYPNPTTDSFVVNDLEAHTSYTITVTDITGKQVLRKNQMSMDGSLTVDLSIFTRGSYTVQVEGGKTNFRGKVILQ